MFKKAVALGPGHKLSGADRKKIRKSLLASLAGATEADIDEFLPPKGDVAVSKLAAPSRGAVYTNAGTPVVVDSSGKGDFYPTVMALWAAPNLLPCLTLKHPAVSKFVIGGADLMSPGVHIPAGGLPPFSAGQLYGVRVAGNPAPIAVGVTAMGSDACIKGKGKVIEVLQVFGDFLWAMAPGRPVPNDGFHQQFVVPVGVDATAGALEDLDFADDEDGEGEGGGAAGEGGTFTPGQDAGEGGEGEDAGEAAAGEAAAGEAATANNGIDMNDLVDMCFLQALATSVKKAALPIAGGLLWKVHLLPARPAGTDVDIKKSSYKKLSKFLHEKAKQGLIRVKDDKHTHETSVTHVNWDHITVADYRPYKDTEARAADGDPAATVGAGAAGGAGAGAAGGAGAGAGLVGGTSGGTLEMFEVYKPAHAVYKIFDEVGADKSAYYTAQGGSEIAWEYARGPGIMGGPDDAPLEKRGSRPDHVLLDPLLCDALFKGAVKKGDAYPSEVPKAQLGPLFLKRMQAHTVVKKGRREELKKGGIAPVQIVVEKRAGNKKMTRVSGLEAFLIDPAELAPAVGRKFAASATVGEALGKKNQMEISVQGDWMEGLTALLSDEYGIPRRYIEGIDRAGGKKR